MWGWAAIAGILMTVIALLVAEPAQLHLMAVAQAHRIAAAPPGEQLRERVALAQVASLARLFLMIGALAGPWVIWFLIALIFLGVAAICRGYASFATAWVAALNSYAMLGIALVANALLVSLHDPHLMTSPLDLVRFPHPGMLVHDNPGLAAFLSAYNPLYIWYYVIVVAALERLMRVPRGPAIAATLVYSVLHGLIAAAS